MTSLGGSPLPARWSGCWTTWPSASGGRTLRLQSLDAPRRRGPGIPRYARGTSRSRPDHHAGQSRREPAVGHRDAALAGRRRGAAPHIRRGYRCDELGAAGLAERGLWSAVCGTCPGSDAGACCRSRPCSAMRCRSATWPLLPAVTPAEALAGQLGEVFDAQLLEEVDESGRVPAPARARRGLPACAGARLRRLLHREGRGRADGRRRGKAGTWQII